MFLIPSWYTNLLVLAVGLAVLDCRHFKTRIQEHVKKYGKSHIFKHLHLTATMFALHNSLSFKIIDKPSSKFDSKIKKNYHINWRKPTLNKQQKHLALALSLQLASPLCSFITLLFFAFVFHELFLRSLTLITDIFYYLNYTSQLLHLITTHIVSHFTFHLLFSLTLC